MMKLVWYVFVTLVATLAWASQSIAENYSVQPVGRVLKSHDKTVLEVFPSFKDGLRGLDGFSHVWVFYWFDRNDSPEKRAILEVHPHGDKAIPLMGVFATRSPNRPNLIGLSICKIKSVDQSGVTVDGIDAFDGSPIIDLKPYRPANDCVPDASVPEWAKRLQPR